MDNGTRNKNIDIVSAHRTMRDKERDHETMRKRTKSWYVTSSDNLFNLQLFYDAIVEMFKRDPQDPWVVDTLKWWKE